MHSLTLAPEGDGQSALCPGHFTQGKSPWYPLDRRLGELQNCFGCGGEEKNSQLPPGIKP
jgi:hypothetical protein